MSIEPRSNQALSRSGASGPQTTNLGDILERVLDKGLVIAGDIRISLLDIELLTVKLRLLIASVDTARQLGIDWWEHDPWLSTSARSGVTDGHRRTEEVSGAAAEAIEAEAHEEDSGEDQARRRATERGRRR